MGLREGLSRRLIKKRSVKENQKKILTEALYLMAEANVPLSSVSRRLKLRIGVLKALLKKGQPDPELLLRNGRSGPMFSKFHDRAVSVLQDLLVNSSRPLLL